MPCDSQSTMSEPDRKIIIDAITRMLARREHSIAEIVRKLAQKDVSETTALPIINEFCEANLQSDERYAEAKIRSSIGRGVGPRRVKADLNQHDISEAMVERAMEEVDPDWFELARAVREKKYGLTAPADFKQKQKQMQFLQYRGFYQSHIQYAMDGD